MIAALCRLPWATAVIHETIREDQKTVYVERELEGGMRDVVEMPLPAVLTVQSGINEPRYPSLSNLIRAIDAGVETIPADSLGMKTRTSINAGYSYPEKIRDGLILQGTAEEKARSLLNILRDKGLL
jgi:electron transfer flavoprotein beta subunit